MIDMIPDAQCNHCKHLDKKRSIPHAYYYCAAYPDGVPAEIALNFIDHHNPYEGDHGIRFEARKKA